VRDGIIRHRGSVGVESTRGDESGFDARSTVLFRGGGAMSVIATLLAGMVSAVRDEKKYEMRRLVLRRESRRFGKLRTLCTSLFEKSVH